MKEADAAAAFALSSPDESAFGSSPAGVALRAARQNCDSMFLAPFHISSEEEEDLDGEAALLRGAAEAAARGGGGGSGAAELDDHESDFEGLEDMGDQAWSCASASEGEEAEEEDSDDQRLDFQGQLLRSTPRQAADSRQPLIHRPDGGARSCSTASGAGSSSLTAVTMTPQDAFQELEETKGKLKGNLTKQRRTHEAHCNTAFCTFTCNCKSPFGSTSCLDSDFDRATFRSYHTHTYGRAPNFHTLGQVKVAVHEAIWELRQPLSRPLESGPRYHVPEWRLGGAKGKVVCKKGFAAVVGGTAFAHRQALTLTIAGKAPSDQKVFQAASRALSVITKRAAPATEWAQSWWRQHLMWHDWLPNEVKIQYRGPAWTIVYSTLYAPMSKRAGRTVKPKQWMRSRKLALEKMHAEFFSSVKTRTLTLVRAARHSKFPECTDCQRKKSHYTKVASDPKSTTEAIDAALADLVEHQQKWQGDRETALDLRHRYSVLSSTARYSVDDKCGSFWQQLPVSETGRDTKDNAKARYKFSVHANVVCGEQGHKVFTFVPKNVGTGANFGLTNLLMTILLAVKSGNLKPHTDTFVRHTDGGPDNVSVVTHFIHWLMVYLGVINRLIWFRFKAGHSHTEVADRLFAIMKRLFESDGAHRVTPVEDFPALIAKIEAEFAKEVESCSFNWNFANWDLRTMMAEMNVVSSGLKGISSKMVYQYTYDANLWEHGCVLVQYKSNIAWKGTARDAEWSPITRVEREMNVGTEGDDDADGEDVQKVECNVSRPKGVRFVTKPPDLRILPRREPFDAKGEKFTPAAQCKAVLDKRGNDLAPASKSFWRCLERFHSNAATVAANVPELPHTINTPERSFTFDGTPRPFFDVMKCIMLRFPRPLLPADPFASAPAETWEAAAQAAPSSTSPPAVDAGPGADQQELRDPRRENTVRDLELTEAEKRRIDRELAEEEFATTQPTRVEEVEIGRLYLCELEVAEHGLRLGLCMAEKEEGPVGPDKLPGWTVAWFVITSKNGWKAKNIAFAPQQKGGRRQTDVLVITNFRLPIEDSDLTKAGRDAMDTHPKFTGGFTDKVRAFARSEQLDGHETEDELSPAESDGEEGGEEGVSDMEEEEEGEEEGEEHGQFNGFEEEHEEDAFADEEEEEEEEEADEQMGDVPMCAGPASATARKRKATVAASAEAVGAGDGDLSAEQVQAATASSGSGVVQGEEASGLQARRH